MGKKRRISITTVILIPVFVLGIVCVISSAQAISNIKKVNANASEIADEYMTSISKLSEIQKETEKIGEDVFGQSITDPCLGWEKTEKLIYNIADTLK